MRCLLNYDATHTLYPEIDHLKLLQLSSDAQCFTAYSITTISAVYIIKGDGHTPHVLHNGIKIMTLKALLIFLHLL